MLDAWQGPLVPGQHPEHSVEGGGGAWVVVVVGAAVVVVVVGATVVGGVVVGATVVVVVGGGGGGGESVHSTVPAGHVGTPNTSCLSKQASPGPRQGPLLSAKQPVHPTVGGLGGGGGDGA